MATRYTEGIKDGISFETFIMRCARNFGALVTMIDDPHDSEIPEFKPSKYYLESLEEKKAELVKVNKMTKTDILCKIEDNYNKEVKRIDENINEANNLKKKYNDMLLKVKEWNTPSPDHKELKKFMIQQIEDSIKHDCDTSYYLRNYPKKQDPIDWFNDVVHSLVKSINYYTEEYDKEVERVNGRNKWVKQLRESLKSE